MADSTVQEGIRAKARELLDAGTAECIIGYERATDGLTARPVFIYTVDEVNRLVFDNSCIHNLAKYLLDRKGKTTALVAKPCDSKAVNMLLNESQLERDKVYIIGVNCQGMADVRWNSIGEALQGRCQRCPQHTPVVYDCLIGDPVESPPSKYSDVEEMERKDLEMKRAFWLEQFSHCIRCYGCRQVCPGCYCTICFADQLDPTWIGIRVSPQDNEVWNTIRAFHLAGRCISCNECERVCPANIPLSLINRKLEKDIGELFDFQSGLDPDVRPPFATFKQDEHLRGIE